MNTDNGRYRKNSVNTVLPDDMIIIMPTPIIPANHTWINLVNNDLFIAPLEDIGATTLDYRVISYDDMLDLEDDLSSELYDHIIDCLDHGKTCFLVECGKRDSFISTSIAVSMRVILALSRYFGTNEVHDLGTYAKPYGCPTCGYVEVGHKIVILMEP